MSLPLTSSSSSSTARRCGPSRRRLPRQHLQLMALLLFFFRLMLVQVAHAELTVPCNETSQCVSILRVGSMCNPQGFCTNPFYNGGCLNKLLPGGWNKTRMCNSQDPPDAHQLGYCRLSTSWNYPEVRLAARNWESANLGAWILQILLSEILDVPTSVEGGSYELNMNLYDVNSGFDIGNAGVDPDLNELEVANQVKDCTKVNAAGPGDNYQPCMHVNQETYASWYNLEDYKSFLEPSRELGAMTENAWFIPRFAAVNDSTLVSYAGLSGEENRRKLAETFKMPTRWGQYCQEFSPTNCAKPDPLAIRAPNNQEEADSFFVDGLYYGFFRYTEQNNCDLYPTNCTGHFVDVTCEWLTYAPAQLYHLDIALSTHRYTYAEQNQIYRAANATKSPIMYQAYTIDLIYADFVGTDAEFTRVLLPAQTQECLDQRNPHICGTTQFHDIVGDPAGACDTAPEMLKKTFSKAFREMGQDPNLPQEFWSPAVEAIEKYQITVPQLGRIYKLWFQRNTDPWNYDPRDAVCQFVVQNFDLVQSWVPDHHPRAVKEVELETQSLANAAIALGFLAIAAVLLSLMITRLKKRTAIIHHTQPQFMNLVLFGMVLVSIGAVVLAATPSDATCASIHWLTNIGYAIQLTPLLHRIWAINNLTSSGKGMQRVKLQPFRMYGLALAVVTLVSVFLLVWYILDLPQRAYMYKLMTQEVTPQGETMVHAYSYCGSNEDFWKIISFSWMAAILLPACLLGFIASQVKEDMNDTTSLALMLYSHAAFLIAWLASFLLLRDSDMPRLMKYSSLFVSADTIMALIIYFVPKFLRSGETIEEEILPDVFVHTTIALLDVQGFTAWSSVREPVQVFQFLEKLYENFDHLAEKHRVYKVETVGECYVAATGIPDPQSDHAVLMARFVSDCTRKMPKFVKKMEEQFGPDTRELTLRVGLNSGPVTGGFLKGKGARFQLFGDTMSTATLIQTNSDSGRIHLSQATADLLIKAGKRRWLLEREDIVHTVEKGEMKTYWLVKNGHPGEDLSFYGVSSAYASDDESEDGDIGSEERWVEWNVKVFKGLLQEILVRRPDATIEPYVKSDAITTKRDMPLDEVLEIIELPAFDKRAARRQRGHEDVHILDKVIEQLKDYVREIARRYNNNAFHNFAHASYVVMAVTKYLNRIIAATDADVVDRFRTSGKAALHDHTYGITSDALTQFACVFAALIHDVAHPGVPNTQFIKENKVVASKYKHRSVAEQNSLDIAWDLLMEERFSDLLSTICQDMLELQRFRQLVVNAIMATDLGDKEMKALRNNRWDKAFARGDSTISSSTGTESDVESAIAETRSTRINRKATIVIEHLIQAADVAHMSQHWNIYRKWNERLFRELYAAYRQGRADSNPADGWYQGEIGFFDFYIIPLSQKLRDCGVFGPTSDENLNYAVNNRNMWKKNGQAITEDMHKRVEAEYKNNMMSMAESPESRPPESALHEPCIANPTEPTDVLCV